MIAAGGIVARLKTMLPSRWFGDTTPVLDALLAGLEAGWLPQFALLEFCRAQTRVATCTDLFVDLVALDFFGTSLRRRRGEPDDAFRARVLRELRRERVTRAAVSAAVGDVTGLAPAIFEPARATDTGAYGAPGGSHALAYNMAGRWGSASLPYTAFVDAALPPPAAPVRQGPGYGVPTASYGATMAYGASGYAEPAAEMAGIAGAIADVLPAAATAWLRINSNQLEA